MQAKYIGEPRHTRQLVGVAHRVLDAYAEVIGSSEEVDHRLAVLKERVMAELRTQVSNCGVDVCIACSTARSLRSVHICDSCCGMCGNTFRESLSDMPPA